MDGVIADFNTYCISLIGRTLDTFPDSQSGWDALGDKKLDMYRHLPPMADAKELVSEVCSLAHHHNYVIGVLTAIPKYGKVPDAKIHKLEWLYKHFPYLSEDFNIGPWAEDKQKHCRVGDILIDDSERNIPQWNARGGFGILHTSAKDSIQKLKDHLENQIVI